MPRPLIAACTAALAASLVSCGGSTPSSSTTSLSPLTIPTTTEAPTSTTADIGGPSTGGPDGAGAGTPTVSQILSSIQVRAAAVCTDGRGIITVSHDPGASRRLRQITAIVDGRQISSTLDGPSGQFAVPDVPCDGAIHTVLVVIIDDGGTSSSRAFAVQMPR